MATSTIHIEIIAKRLTGFGRPLSGGQKVSVGLCGSVANKKSQRPSALVCGKRNQNNPVQNKIIQTESIPPFNSTKQ
jgi:hypothetical protein